MRSTLGIAASILAATLAPFHPTAEAGNRVLRLGTASAAADAGDMPAWATPVQAGAMTVEFWLRLEPATTFGRPFTIRGCSCAGITIQANVVGQSGRLNVELGGLGDWDAAGFSLSEWHHFAVTWSRQQGTLQLHVDGAFVGEHGVPTTSSLQPCGGEPLRFGEQCGRGMVGAIDNVRYWSVVRTSEQIAADMDRQYTASEAQSKAGLEGSWTFEDGTVSTPVGGAPGTLEGGATIEEECLSASCRDADLFRDCLINGADLGILLSQWGPANPGTVSDINKDGVVDGVDLGLLLASWGACQ